MFVDIHVHFRTMLGFKCNGGEKFSTPEQLIARYDQIGIERAVVLPMVSPECAYASQSNEEVLEVAQKNSRFIPFCNVDPRSLSNSCDAPLGDMLKYYRDKGCKGVGEITANLHFLDPMVQNLFKGAEDANLPVTFHIAPAIGNCYGLFTQVGLGQLEESLRRFPKLKFFGHSKPFWAEISELRSPHDRFSDPAYPVEEEGRVPDLMRKYPNLYGDLSATSGFNALNRDRRYAIKFLNEFQDRLMFGTDICAPGTPTHLVDLLLDLHKSGDIAQSVFLKVARENAIRVLDL